MSLSPPSSPKSPLPAEEKLKKLKLKAFRTLVKNEEFASHYAEQLIKIPAIENLLKSKFGSARDSASARANLLTCIKCVLNENASCAICLTAFNGISSNATNAIQPSIDAYLSSSFEFINDKGTMSVPLMELAAILLFRSNDFKGIKPYYPIPSHLFTVTGFGSISDCKKTTKAPPSMVEEGYIPTVKQITPDEMEKILKDKKIMDADNGKKINLGYITLPGSAVDPNVNTTDPTNTTTVILSFNPAGSKEYIISMIVPRSSTPGATIRFTFQEILLNGEVPVPTGYIDEYTWTCNAENLMFNYEKQQSVVGGRRRRNAKSKTKRLRSRSKRLRMWSRTRKGNKKNKNKSSRTRR